MAHFDWFGLFGLLAAHTLIGFVHSHPCGEGWDIDRDKYREIVENRGKKIEIKLFFSREKGR